MWMCPIRYGILTALAVSLPMGPVRSQEPRPPEPTLEALLALDPFPGNLGPLPQLPDSPAHPGLAELGSVLFFDERLSPGQNMSCATCHQPQLAWTDGKAIAMGNTGEPLLRNTPTILNTGFLTRLFWDGRSPSLEDQVRSPLMAENEHGFADERALESAVTHIPDYVDRFDAVLGTTPTLESIARAIAAFERTLITPNARFDQFIAGNQDVLTPQERDGLRLFVGKASCTLCHQGPLFTDELDHSLDGREAVRTPGLRNSGLTAPYMHDGRFSTLEDVVGFYNRGGGPGDEKSAMLFPLGLSGDEVASLVAFLHTLTGEIEPLESLQEGKDRRPSPGHAPAIDFVPEAPESFDSVRDLMGSGIHEQFSFLGFNLWHETRTGARVRKAIASSAQTLAVLADRGTALFADQSPLPEEQDHFNAGMGDLSLLSRSLQMAASHGPRSEMEAQFDRIERRCSDCHTRYRPDLVWTGADD